MTAYLSFEWLKLSRRWMPRIIALMLVAITVLAFWGQGTRVEGRVNLFMPRGWLMALAYCSFFAPFFWPVLGGSWAGSEYGWGTIRTILTRRPHRIEHVLAALAVLLVGLLAAIVLVLITATIAGIFVSLFTGNAAFSAAILTSSFVGTLVKGVLAAWYISGFYLLVAYTMATIFRSAAVGIGIGIGATLAQIVVGQILRSLGGVWNDIALHFPFVYTNDFIVQVVHSGLAAGTRFARVDPTTPSALSSLIVVAAYSAALLAVTLITVRRRDVVS